MNVDILTENKTESKYFSINKEMENEIENIISLYYSNNSEDKDLARNIIYAMQDNDPEYLERFIAYVETRSRTYDNIASTLRYLHSYKVNSQFLFED